ncbi:MAG: putative rane protein [Herbinix sp.]|jgi:N-acetylmuramoyl-L-alanine amidase|nr:putative rane protein [Herbinix sp.]
MSIINLFLQKRKLHESQHGIIMVIVAYALSVMMLILGSDVFYNINSEAAGISTKAEETQEKIKEELPDQHTEDLSAFLIQSKLQNPFGIAEATETGLGSSKAQNVLAGTVNTEAAISSSTIWLLGNAMDQFGYDQLMESIPKFTSISTVMSSGDKEVALAPAQVVSGSEEEIYSLSTEEADSSNVFDVSDDEIDMLERIVQAEAGGEDMVGKILIVNVILNRIADESFPDTVEEVIFQNKNGEYQFSPVDDKSYWSVDISDKTKKAVLRALEGEDYSEGALYFVARKRTNASSARWFDKNLKWLFKHGGHEFYKEK